MTYLVIVPVYNEEKHIETFIDSIITQKLRPTKLVLVDDSSTDASSQIIKQYSDNYNWIEYVLHISKQKKIQGSKVIEAFNFGLKNHNIDSYDFISKIDADLELPSNYFSLVSESFIKNPKVGLSGGFIKENINGQWKEIVGSSYHIRGALKSYRVECFKQINGLMPVLGWDGLDEMTMLYLGWETHNLNIGVKHFRPAASDYNPIYLAYKTGMANYRNGGSVFLSVVRTIVRFIEKPYVLKGMAYFIGYLKALLSRDDKNVDKDLGRFINKFHLQRLLTVNKKNIN